MKFEIGMYALFLAQVVLVSVGIWQIRQPETILQIVGGFNILLNLIGIGMNLKIISWH